MAKRAFKSSNFTFTANTTNAVLANSTYLALRGGSGSQIIDVLEIMISGKVGTSTVLATELARSSTIATTPTALATPNSDGPMHPATAALAAPPVSFVAASAGPTVSTAATDAKLNLALNGFGGIVRWNAAPTQQWTIVGNTTSGGETVLWNSSTSGGVNCAADAHIIYEPY